MELINSSNPVLNDKLQQQLALEWYRRRNGIAGHLDLSYMTCIREILNAATAMGWQIVIIPKE